MGMVTRDELAGIKLLHGESIDRVQALLQSCPILLLDQGDTLITPGQENHNCYFILKGSLHVHVEVMDMAPLATIGVGQSVGELSIIDGMPTTAYVVADSDCELLVVNEDVLWSMINISHEMSINLMLLMSRRLRDNNTAFSRSIRKEREYKRSANMDELTGLYNRRWFHEVLDKHMQRSQLSSDPLCLMMLDIDHFKRFNDDHGHHAGDHVLKIVARILRDRLKPAGLLARYGGEEFIALLPDTNNKEALRMARLARSSISQTTFNMDDGSVLPRVTISIGLVEMQPPEIRDELIKRADALLYRAKKNGRNRVEST
jgi:diguanylate cyclase (GGDEF)-like protein